MHKSEGISAVRARARMEAPWVHWRARWQGTREAARCWLRGLR
jgi:hypothetical protein